MKPSIRENCGHCNVEFFLQCASTLTWRRPFYGVHVARGFHAGVTAVAVTTAALLQRCARANVSAACCWFVSCPRQRRAGVVRARGAGVPLRRGQCTFPPFSPRTDTACFLVAPLACCETRLNQSGCRVSVCGNFFSDQPLSPSWFDRSR